MPKTKKKYPETVSASLPEGALDRIDEARGKKTRGEYVRDLILSRLDATDIVRNGPPRVWPTMPARTDKYDHEYEEERMTDMDGQYTHSRCYICGRDEH